MPLPDPEPGLVISYGYLWRSEHEAGLEEGRKVRPCVIVLAVEEQSGVRQVTVAPVTHRPPTTDTIAIEIPPRVKAHLGLDAERSWIIVSEVNQFTWPGYDLEPVPRHPERYDYGFLPPRLFGTVKETLTQTVKNRLKKTARD